MTFYHNGHLEAGKKIDLSENYTFKDGPCIKIDRVCVQNVYVYLSIYDLTDPLIRRD